MVSDAAFRAALRLEPSKLNVTQIAVGISIIIGMTIVSLLAAGVPLGFISVIGFFLLRTQTGLIVLCILAWGAHVGEALFGFIIMSQASVPTDIKIRWTMLIALFGYLSLGPLRQKLKALNSSMSEDNKSK
eukprot:TRINITY_DN3556_c0_g1_i1.p1 TRINITY_DN3556_c0_g1~~TRINITY_DN3556_c0_g1_i1.p1  ORF type:complete len:131 (-),score=30.82 TRINITY_DN3556_c0_g1_i1:38-430(-)